MLVKRYISLMVISLVVLAGASFAEDSQDVAIITYLEGDVQVRADEESGWEAAELEAGLREGGSIRTGADSKAKFALEDDSLVVVGALSVFEITEVAIPSAGASVNASFFLGEGMVRAEVTKLQTAGSSFEIHTPTAVAGVRGTDFLVEAPVDAEETTVTVFDGEVDVGNRVGKVKKFVRVLKDHAADVRGGAVPGSPKKVNEKKLKVLKKLMAHKLKDKVKGKFAELDDKKAAALLALRGAGMDKEMVSGLVSGMKKGEIPAGRIKDVLSLAAHGAEKGDIKETLSMLKDRKISAKDVKNLVQAAKERDSEGVREEIKEFEDKASDSPDQKPGGKKPDDKKPKDKDPADMDKDELKERINQMDPNDPRRREMMLMQYALERGVPREKIDALMKPYREGRLDHTEMKMFIGAVTSGVDPRFIRDALVKLGMARADRKARLLVLTALDVGIPKDRIDSILKKLEDGEVTVEQVKEYIKKLLQKNPPPTPRAAPSAPSGNK